MTTPNILMIRPAAFAHNPQTAINNLFQQKSPEADVHNEALKEFDSFVTLLRENEINVMVWQDQPEPHTPDALFPNNWVSFHEDGTIVLYPMFAPNRQLERDQNILQSIEKNFYVRSVLDFTHYEKQKIFLEGTGSMVFDRENELAYACLSPRTNPTALYDFCDAMGYLPVLFEAFDDKDAEIYHTNVMMCVGDEYMVICLESVKDLVQKKMLMDKFEETDKTVIEISMQQMKQFAGNMLQVENKAGEKRLVMSTRAYESLTEQQRVVLETFNAIIHSPLTIIEQNGGGSARCMMAEIFLPPLQNDDEQGS